MSIRSSNLQEINFLSYCESNLATIFLQTHLYILRCGNAHDPVVPSVPPNLPFLVRLCRWRSRNISWELFAEWKNRTHRISGATPIFRKTLARTNPFILNFTSLMGCFTISHRGCYPLELPLLLERPLHKPKSLWVSYV